MSDDTYSLVLDQMHMYACCPYVFKHHSIMVKNSILAPIIATLPFFTMSIAGFVSVTAMWVFVLFSLKMKFSTPKTGIFTLKIVNFNDFSTLKLPIPTRALKKLSFSSNS